MLSFLRDADVLDAWLSSQRSQIDNSDEVNLAACEDALNEVEKQHGRATAYADKIKQLRLQTKVNKKIIIYLN